MENLPPPPPHDNEDPFFALREPPRNGAGSYQEIRDLFGEILDHRGGGPAKYHILDKVGEGAEADIYRAAERDVERPHVALKVLKEEHRNNADIVRHFRRAAERLARLQHVNIVALRELGRPDQQPPYVALQYASGGSLADHQERLRHPREVGELMLKVARAIQYAHEHGVLHGDISPSNILMDGDNPLVTDFIARRVGQTTGGISGGKYNYMSPEKASNKGHGDTMAADVFGLGAVLYELLSGSPPVRATSAEEVRTAYETGKLRRIVTFRGRAGVEHEELLSGLDAQCRIALHSDPGRRFSSAQVFADNLERTLNRPSWANVRVSVRRHPWLTFSALAGLALLGAAEFYVARSASDGEEAQAHSTLENNTYLAQLHAQGMLVAFENYERAIQESVTNTDIIRYLETRSGPPPIEVLRQHLERSQLDGIAIFDRAGTLIARYPDPGVGLVGSDFSFRDYHTCISGVIDAVETRGLDGACITPVFLGESSKTMEIAFAVPVLDANRRAVGYEIQSYHARRRLELKEIHNRQTGSPGQRTVAMFGRRGVDRQDVHQDDAALRQKLGRLTAAAHPTLFGAAERWMTPELSAQLIARFTVGLPGAQILELDAEPLTESHYLDPVTHSECLAAFAPVGRTGYVIAVSTPREVALASWVHHSQLLTIGLGAFNAFLVGLTILVIRGASRRPRQRTGAP